MVTVQINISPVNLYIASNNISGHVCYQLSLIHYMLEIFLYCANWTAKFI